LRLLQQLKTIPLFVRYYLTVVDEHSIQAPFAFQFYKKLKNEIETSEGIKEIEDARLGFLSEQTKIVGEDLGAGSRARKVSSFSSIARLGISSKNDCIFLQSLANICKAKVCIELGTSLGISTAYLSSSDCVKSMYSFEGNEGLAKKARALFKSLNIDKAHIIHGNIDGELPLLLNQLDVVDLALIDANHTRPALLRYYQMLAPKMSDGGVIVIDDIRWSVEMYKGWNKLISKSEVSLSMEFLNKGLLFFKKGMQKQHYVISI
jgi:predicted O-methyltransferase YrrM